MTIKTKEPPNFSRQGSPFEKLIKYKDSIMETTTVSQQNTKNIYDIPTVISDTVPDFILPESYQGDVIAQVWITERGRYAYLAGRIEGIEENHAGQKVAVIRFHAPIQAKVQRVLWNNIVTSDAVIELKYGGEFYVACIEQIDFTRMEVTDEFGERVWLPIHTITQIISHQDLAEDFVMRQIHLAKVS